LGSADQRTVDACSSSCSSSKLSVFIIPQVQRMQPLQTVTPDQAFPPNSEIAAILSSFSSIHANVI
jgi:hypothetical protein